MKAARMHYRGGPDALVWEDAPRPAIGREDALIRVRGAGTTPAEFTWNSTFTTADGKDRLPIIPSFEVSGTVEEVGPAAEGVAVGDEVYGLLDFWRNGAAAEYVAVKAAGLAAKPTSLDPVAAAAVPLSGLTAWQALFDHAQVSAGDRVLIHGAGGGVGTFAVQLAHERGARVLATASAAKAAFLRDLGADEVLDYAHVRFEDHVRNVDVVLDTVGGETLDRSWAVLRRGGLLVTIAGDAPEATARAHGVRGVSFLVQPDRQELTELARRIDGGALRPIVEAVYPLDQAREAYERGSSGHNRGKIVLRVADEGLGHGSGR